MVVAGVSPAAGAALVVGVADAEVVAVAVSVTVVVAGVVADVVAEVVADVVADVEVVEAPASAAGVGGVSTVSIM